MGKLLSSFRESVLGSFVFRSITLKFSKGKELYEADEINGGIGKDEDLKTLVGSKFFCPVP